MNLLRINGLKNYYRSKAASRLNIHKVDKHFLSDLLSTEKHQGIAAKIRIDDFFDLKSSIKYLSQITDHWY